MRSQLILSLGAAAAASAKTITIKVGQSGLKFDPDTVTAEKGDTLAFEFFNDAHDVVMGDFSNACKPAEMGGFYSGFPGKGETFSVMVNDTKPMAFYCSASSHCQSGMVGVVNPDSSSDSENLDAYTKAASSSSGSDTPSDVFGGTLGKTGSGSMSSSGTGSSSGGGSTETAMSSMATNSAPSTTSMSSMGGASSEPASSTTGSAPTTTTTGAASNVKAEVGGVLAAGIMAALML